MVAERVLEWEKFIDKFGDWADKIKPFWESGGLDELFSRLRAERKAGRVIVPDSKDLFRCFTETKLSDLKVVMIGMSPYHSMFKDKSGMLRIIADGLLMGCSHTGECQPSLTQYYHAIEMEFGDEVVYNPNIKFLASQGVLMFNACLTTYLGKAGGHLDIWEPFMDYMFDTVFNDARVPIIYLGKQAQELQRFSNSLTMNFSISHPASASYKETDWDSEGIFKRVGNLVTAQTGEIIQWAEKLPF